MNTATGYLLFFVGSFALLITLLETPALEFYTGAFVIFLFLGVMFYALLNTIRQTSKMAAEKKVGEAAQAP